MKKTRQDPQLRQAANHRLPAEDKVVERGQLDRMKVHKGSRKSVESHSKPQLVGRFAPYYSTAQGQAFLADAVQFLRHIESDSVDLVLTSPPFALKRKKEYGNEDEDQYCDWFLSFAPDIKRILAPRGSFVLDLGGAYKPGFTRQLRIQFSRRFGKLSEFP